jgi:S-methylmethionine-dependent homocysteine/selenocysteine methylase
VNGPSEPARHLLAGSLGPERLPARPDPEEPRWHEPLHVRHPAAERERIAEQVVSGATVVVAPTWRTHRRALMAVGESRRAAAWTARAVQLAREGVEVGLERRAQEIQASQAGPGSDAPRRAAWPPTVLVAGVLPPLEDAPEPGTGRLPSAAAASDRDQRALAGHLADAAADLVLVMPRTSLAASRVATLAAAESGLTTWVSAAIAPAEARTEARLPDGAPLEAWLELVRDCGAAAALVGRVPPGALPPSDATSARLRDSGLRWGTLGSPEPPRAWGAPEMERWARGWIVSGAQLVGIEDGATSERVAAMRAALDAAEAEERAAEDAVARRWRAFLEDAARGAAGGPALWLDATRPDDLPPGFDWTVARPTEVDRLPRARYRLVVNPAGAGVPPARIAPALDEGGLLVTAIGAGGLQPAPELRIVTLDDDAVPALFLLRRDPG